MPVYCYIRTKNCDEERDTSASSRSKTELRNSALVGCLSDTYCRGGRSFHSNLPLHPGSEMFRSRPFYAPERTDPDELSFPFARNTPGNRNLVRVTFPSKETKARHPTLLSKSSPKSASNRDGTVSEAKSSVDEHLDYFAEFNPHHPCNSTFVSVPPSQTNSTPRPYIVNTPFGLAMLLGQRDPNAIMNPSMSCHHPRTMRLHHQPHSHHMSITATDGREGNNYHRKFQRWTREEDRILKIAVKNEGPPPMPLGCWRHIATKYFGNARTAVQCRTRCKKVCKGL